MIATTTHERITLNEDELAAALSISTSWLQHDRRHQRLLPFYKVGGRVLYNRQRVLEALARMEEGGQPARRRGGATA